VIRCLLTGAGGFTGCHVLRHLLVNTDWNITCPVTFRHRGNTDRIASAIYGRDDWHRRVDVTMCDLTAPVSPTVVDRWGHVDYILNIASESHVDRSLTDPVPFVRNNVDLMLNVLEYARLVKPRLLLQMSTDEVYGPAPGRRRYREWDTHVPSNPYSASKSAQEAIAISYWRAYDVPLVITNTMNLFGQMQDTEKYFAKIMRAVLRDEAVTVHIGSNGEMGSRFYIHARNFADAWLHIIRLYDDEPGYSPDLAHVDGTVGLVTLPRYATGAERPARYNIVGDQEVTNLELAQLIAKEMGRDLRWVPLDYHSSRPGHDLRYALDGTKIAQTGWRSPVSFEESVAQTVRWSLKNPGWL
jgi:dTDP-glucose 4,6-dehydratase